MSAQPQSNRLLVGSTLGLMGGLFLLLTGRDIMDAVSSGTYTTVFGLEVIDSLVAIIGAVVCIISVLGIIGGVWIVVMRTK